MNAEESRRVLDEAKRRHARCEVDDHGWSAHVLEASRAIVADVLWDDLFPVAEPLEARAEK
jgi:hypothetical protein